ncbi:MAG: iron transporter FeoA [Simkaniaceae bacterium]|nr:iron transporter FeoA [Simkaniaceae bacterium]
MSEKLNLTHINPGEIAQIVGFSDEAKMTSRLVEMGLIPGVAVRMVKAAPFNGPVEVKVREYYVSIRQVDAQHIYVKKLG